MFRWDKEKAIDFACIDGITIPEIAEKLGTSVSSVEKFYNRNRAELFAARNETAVSERTYGRVMELWGEMFSREEIAEMVGVSVAVVRRLILSAEYDEEPVDQCAGLELLALHAAHPDRLYEDDVRALTECSHGQPRLLGYGADYVQPLGEEAARYKVSQPEKRKHVTLAMAA